MCKSTFGNGYWIQLKSYLQLWRKTNIPCTKWHLNSALELNERKFLLLNSRIHGEFSFIWLFVLVKITKNDSFIIDFLYLTKLQKNYSFIIDFFQKLCLSKAFFEKLSFLEPWRWSHLGQWHKGPQGPTSTYENMSLVDA